MSSKGRAKDRQPDDFYVTPSWATDAILPHLNLDGNILEPAAGDGAIALRLLEAGVNPIQLALGELDADRAALCQQRAGRLTHVDNFLTEGWEDGKFDLVITNPPYVLAEEFILRAKEVVRTTGEVAMLLRLNFLSGLKRVQFWRKHPAHVFVLPRRPSYCKVLRDVYRCVRCKRTWKVPHEAGPFAVPVEDQCECGEIPVFTKTTKTANDSCEYAWFVFGPKRERRWDVLELPETAVKEIPGGSHARIHRIGNGQLREELRNTEG